MRVIVPCAGQATRWVDESVSKHLVKICGEPVLHRTVRLLGELAPAAEVVVVVENAHDPAYKIDGARRTAARLGTARGDIDKIASSRHQWAADDWTLILFGDVWWSLPALAALLTSPPDDGEWQAYLRFGPSGVGGEIFGFAFAPHHHAAVDEAISTLDQDADLLATAGHDGYPVRGGWALYRLLAGGDPQVHADLGHRTLVDDWTEDMDTRSDWERWCYRWAKASSSERAAQVG